MWRLKCFRSVRLNGPLDILTALELRVWPNVLVKWLTLLLRICEVPGSLLGSSDRLCWLSFSWFSLVPPDECRHSTLNYATTASYQVLSNSSSFTYNYCISSTLYSLVIEKRCEINYLPTKQTASGLQESAVELLGMRVKHGSIWAFTPLAVTLYADVFVYRRWDFRYSQRRVWRLVGLWDVAPCNLIYIDRRFRSLYCPIIWAIITQYGSASKKTAVVFFCKNMKLCMCARLRFCVCGRL
jgi:hypothetical protein